MIKDDRLSDSEKYALLLKFDEVLGLDLLNIGEAIPKSIIALVEKREQLRAEKNYDESDNLRKKIEKLGYIVLDEIDGYRIIKGSNSS